MSDVMIGSTTHQGLRPVGCRRQGHVHVRQGEVLGFLGPNGAGKSTTMKMLTCYLAPDRRPGQVAGHDVSEDSLGVRRRIGYLPENTPLYHDMTVLEFLQFAAEHARHGPRPGAPGGSRRSARAAAWPTSPARRSASSRRASGSASASPQAMLHDPDLLILDEPTSGLDPNQIVEIRALIKEHRARRRRSSSRPTSCPRSRRPAAGSSSSAAASSSPTTRPTRCARARRAAAIGWSSSRTACSRMRFATGWPP